MDQFGGAQTVAGPFPAHVARRQPSELVIKPLKQLRRSSPSRGTTDRAQAVNSTYRLTVYGVTVHTGIVKG